eukprot:956282-Amphidinium_carterae.3
MGSLENQSMISRHEHGSTWHYVHKCLCTSSMWPMQAILAESAAKARLGNLLQGYSTILAKG